MSKKPKVPHLQSSFETRHQVVPGSEFHGFLKNLHRISSTSSVRPLIIPSGRRARGHCSARKVIGRASYESLLECQVWKILDTASLVRSFISHPLVLQLRTEQGQPFKYTPDAILRVGDPQHSGGLIVEVKARYFMTQKATRERIQTISKSLHQSGLRYALILDSDLQPNLVDALDFLWSRRPALGPWSPHHDLDTWDPRTSQDAAPAVVTAWNQAKAECDALLDHVMRRDPGDIDGILTAA